MDTSVKSPSALQQELGHGIRALRINRHLTQPELAAKAGVATRAIAQLERGEGSNVSTLVRALHALQATEFISNLAPQPTVSPLALLRAPTPAQRVRRQRAA